MPTSQSRRVGIERERGKYTKIKSSRITVAGGIFEIILASHPVNKRHTTPRNKMNRNQQNFVEPSLATRHEAWR